MCRPDYFEVVYSVNPWMDVSIPTSTRDAVDQWEALVALLVELGHEVSLIDPVTGQPDMVFCANAGVVIGQKAVGSLFGAPFRRPDSLAYADWLRHQGIDVTVPTVQSEGQGDFLVDPYNEVIYAGWGIRSVFEAQFEIAECFGWRIVPLRLVDQRFYHLDTALSVLGPETALYVPEAFDSDALDSLQAAFADLVAVSADEASRLAANAISDGLNVISTFMPGGELERKLKQRGFQPHSIWLPELMKSGGGARCCVLEIF